MAILLTGGTGHTSTRLAHLLQQSQIPLVLTSRKGQEAAPAGIEAVRFDFTDPSTYDAPFDHRNNDDDHPAQISAIYLVPPQAADPAAAMNAFIDHAVTKHGVRRFVLVTGSTVERDQPYGHGPTWKHLDDLAVKYSVLRASWFMGVSPFPPPLTSVQG
jgi:festuclavine dehydrogenase